MTRACMSALKLDFAAAFHYHPLFWALPIALIVFLILRKKRTVLKKLAVIAGCIMIAVWLVRMILGSDIVVFSPGNGIIPRIIRFISGKIT